MKVKSRFALAGILPLRPNFSRAACADSSGLYSRKRPLLRLRRQEEKVSGHIIKSPMVGTFYRSASPGSALLSNLVNPLSLGKPSALLRR